MDSEAKSYDKTKSNDEETKTFQQILMKKNIISKTQNFYILLAFLLITIGLLTAVSIYCYLIKYRAKQKHLLPSQVTNKELKEVMY